MRWSWSSLALGLSVLAGCTGAPGGDDAADATTEQSSSSTDDSSTSGDGTDDGEVTASWTGGPDPTETGGDETGGGQQVAPEIIDFETCELDWPESASVVGTTPQGEFNGKYAWFGWILCNGEGLSPTLVIAEDPADLIEAVQTDPDGDAVPKPSLEWFLFGACSPAGGWVGEGKVQVFLRHDGPWDFGEGLIQVSDTHRIFDNVDPDDPPRMTGHIEIQNQDGWDLEGDFEAAYCGPLSYSISCD